MWSSRVVVASFLPTPLIQRHSTLSPCRIWPCKWKIPTNRTNVPPRSILSSTPTRLQRTWSLFCYGRIALAKLLINLHLIHPKILVLSSDFFMSHKISVAREVPWWFKRQRKFDHLPSKASKNTWKGKINTDTCHGATVRHHLTYFNGVFAFLAFSSAS